jgi:hypothetical protein
MRVHVVPLFDRGVAIPERDRGIGFEGELRSSNSMDKVRGRVVKEVALVTINAGGQFTHVLPPLADVQLVVLQTSAMVITGFERVKRSDGREADYAQSWWIRFESP